MTDLSDVPRSLSAKGGRGLSLAVALEDGNTEADAEEGVDGLGERSSTYEANMREEKEKKRKIRRYLRP